MKNTLPKILAAFAILLLLPGCFWSDDDVSENSETGEIEKVETPPEVVKKEVPKIFYISESASECESIFFTCPEGRAFFTDEKGCGCREGAEAFSSDKKGLGDLIREHLAANLIEPKCDGGVLAEFVYIDEGATESGNLNYDVWAVAREFCPEGGEGASFDGAVAFEIEQTDFTRVVRDFTAADSSETSKIQKHFTEKAAEWILAKENFARDQVIAEIENNIEKRLSRFQSQLDRENAAREAELAAQAAAEKIKNEVAAMEESIKIKRANENTEINCAKEGEQYSSIFTDDYPEKCCSGLTEWASGMDTRKVENGECVETGMVSGSPVGTCLNCGNGVCEEIENICNCPEDCSDYFTISELNDFCGVPGTCGQNMDCEGKELKIKGYVNYVNVFDKKNYPQLPYEKFEIHDKAGSSFEVWAISKDNGKIFNKIHEVGANAEKMVYVKGVAVGFDMPMMAMCTRDIRLEIDSEDDIYFAE